MFGAVSASQSGALKRKRANSSPPSQEAPRFSRHSAAARYRTRSATRRAAVQTPESCDLAQSYFTSTKPQNVATSKSELANPTSAFHFCSCLYVWLFCVQCYVVVCCPLEAAVRNAWNTNLREICLLNRTAFFGLTTC